MSYAIVYACIFVCIVFLDESIASSSSMIANQDSRRLYDDLIGGYNRLVRPVSNNSDKLTVYMSLKLTQILDVDEKNQIMTTNVWVRQVTAKKTFGILTNFMIDYIFAF